MHKILKCSRKRLDLVICQNKLHRILELVVWCHECLETIFWRNIQLFP